MLLYPTATFATIFRSGAASITLRSMASVRRETRAFLPATRVRSSVAGIPPSPEYTSTLAAASSFLITDEGSLRVTSTEDGIGFSSRATNFFALALGPHPQRELTLTPRRGFPGPRLGVAAGAFAL